MKCPNCGAESDYVIDTRKRRDFIYRRRKCVKCGCRYLTHETIVRPCSDWAYADKTKVLSLSQLKKWEEAVWIETKAYGGNTLFATSIYDTVGNAIRFENGQVRMIGLYGKQWRAWTKKPMEADLKTEWSAENDGAD